MSARPEASNGLGLPMVAVWVTPGLAGMWAAISKLRRMGRKSFTVHDLSMAAKAPPGSVIAFLGQLQRGGIAVASGMVDGEAGWTVPNWTETPPRLPRCGRPQRNTDFMRVAWRCMRDFKPFDIDSLYALVKIAKVEGAQKRLLKAYVKALGQAGYLVSSRGRWTLRRGVCSGPAAPVILTCHLVYDVNSQELRSTQVEAREMAL